MAQSFRMGKHIQTDLGQDLLAGFLQDHRLQIGADQAHHQNAGINRHDGIQSVQLELFLLDKTLDAAHQQGRGDFIADGKQHDHAHRYEILPIRFGIPQQPGHDLPIGHMPLPVGHIFFLPPQNAIGYDEQGGKHANDGTHNEKG